MKYLRLVRIILPGSFLFLLVGIAGGGDWPQYGGPERNCVSRETGLLRQWPPEGPLLLWKITDLGTGLFPVSVVGSRVYTLAMRNKDEFAIALDRGTGKEIWATSLGVSRESPSMSFLRQRQPVVDGDRLYVFSSQGHLVCLDADGGRELWRKKYKEDFGGRSSSFGWTDNPLIDGDKLLCTPGGTENFIVALNKVSGEVLWKTSLGSPFYPSHAPMVAVHLAGTRQYVQNTANALVSVAADDGRLLWTYRKVSGHTANMAYVIPFGKQLFVASGFNTGCALLEVSKDGEKFQVEEKYFSKSFQNLFGGLAPLGDYVYAGNGPTFGQVNPACINMKTGKLAWQQRGNGTVATIAADGRIYFRLGSGLMILAEATPESYKEKGKFMPPDRAKFPAWSVPVIAHGRLFLRDQNVLLCYDLRRDSPIRKLPKEKQPDSQKPKVPVKPDLNRQPDTVYIPSPPNVVERMLQLAKVTRNDLVYDLGCGDGRIPITAAKKYGARGIGIELDSALVQEARAKVKKEGLQDRVTIRHGDVFFEDFQNATVVTLYLLPHLNQKLIPKLLKLRPGARIVSHAFGIEGFPADKTIRLTGEDGITEHTLFLWTAPLKKKE